MGEIIKGKTIADKIKLDISEFVNFRKANNFNNMQNSIYSCWRRWRVYLLHK